MVFKLNELKDVCSKILAAVDSSENSLITDTLELKVENKVLNLSVTNMRYYVRVKMSVGIDVPFHASVNAGLFLRLISSLTSENVELVVDSTNLKIIGDGTYKIPLIFNGDKLLELPTIEITNKTKDFNITKDNLLSMLKYNISELSKGSEAAVYVKPVQKLLYLDENGCITFTIGACVNKFTLSDSIKILLSPEIVKLFRLFKDNDVKFEMGHKDIGNGIIQTRVSFSDSVVKINYILPGDDNMLNSVPTTAIRNKVVGPYNFSVNLNRDALLNTIKRLSLFTSKNKKSSVSLHFKNDFVEVSDENQNSESLKYDSSNLQNCDYTCLLSVDDLKLTLETFAEKFVVVSFDCANPKAIMISRGNIFNVLPERDNW